MAGITILSEDQEENPAFWDYHHVYLPYCTSDFWVGSGQPDVVQTEQPLSTAGAERQIRGGVQPFYFAGSKVLQSVIMTLQQELSASTEVVIAGSSAGGIGGIQFAATLQSVFPALNVRLLIDSAWGADLSVLYAGSSNSAPVRDFSLYNMTDEAMYCVLNAACAVQRLSPTTDLMVINSLYDIYVASTELEDQPMLGSTALFSKISTYGGAAQMAMVQGLLRFPRFSMFLPACMQHVFLPATSRDLFTVSIPGFEMDVVRGIWNEVVVGNTPLRQAIHAWGGNQGEVVRLVDACSVPGCNPTCPEEVNVVASDHEVLTDEAVALMWICGAIFFVALPASIISASYGVFWIRRYTSESWKNRAQTTTSTSLGKDEQPDVSIGIADTIDGDVPSKSFGAKGREFFMVIKDLNYYVPCTKPKKGEIQILRNVNCKCSL